LWDLQERLELYKKAKELYVTEKSYRKIAKKLGLPPGTVCNWICSGRIPGRPTHSLTTKIQNQKLEETELGWLAGIIDGEGSLMLHKGKDRRTKRGFNWTLRLQVVNKDLKIINKVKKLCGDGGSIHTRPHNLQAFCANSNVIRYILPQILDILVSKHRQAELTLEALKLLQEATTVNARLHDVRLEEIYWEMKKLNHRGD